MADNLLPLEDLAAQIAAHAERLGRQVEAEKNSDHVTLIKIFHNLRGSFDKIAEAKKNLDVVHDRLSRDYIPEAARRYTAETGFKPPFNVEGIGRVSIAHRFSCSIKEKDEGIKWLKDNGYGDLVQETVNSSTLSAFAKRLISDEGKELPEDLFKTGASPYTSITKV